MEHALVWGLGKSGCAAAKLLKQKGWQVTVYDRNNTTALQDREQELAAVGIAVFLNTDLTPAALEHHRIDLLVVSPGIPWHHPILEAARQQGIPVWGEVELAWKYLQGIPWIGITGTNGKSTTTALLECIFAVAGIKAPACGNIGLPICEIVLQDASPEWIIAELSSYQIEASPSVRPQIGLWTTFTPDHLSRHGTIQNYAKIKAHLLHQSHHAILNADDAYLQGQEAAAFPRAIWTSTRSEIADGAYLKSEWVWFQQEKILPLSQWQLLGNHNLQNLLMAVAAARLAGISPDRIAAGVARFRGIPHRLEPLGTVNQICWINDSKATNYDAALIGLQAVNPEVILIAGGEAKEGDAQPWLEEIQSKVAYVLLIGAAAPLFAQWLEACHFERYAVVDTLESAVDRAWELAPTLRVKTILFSPACASFDQYQNFEQRGEHFRQLCRAKGVIP